MSQTTSIEPFQFELEATAGDSRTGQLHVNGQSLPTPNLFPVMNFYAGGTKQSVFGGGIHRTMKEFMIGADRVGTDPLTEFFDATMVSVASFTDYNISEERYKDYMQVPIKERKLFEPFDGLVFTDSGGFKFLDNSSVGGRDFQLNMDQEEVYKIQKSMGGDIIVNLDHPIAPDDTHEDRVRKATQTADNIHKFLTLTQEFSGAQYLTLHGYNYSMMMEYLEIITDRVPMGILREGFDGIALGSLVPKKDDKEALIRAVTDCKEVMAEWDISEWPLHVLGISSRATPILAALGVDSFDSSTHLHNAINGKYQVSLMESVHIDKIDFDDCDCPVCQSELLVERMQGNAEYQKDILGPVAMHNLIIQKRELAKIRDCIRQDGSKALIEYFEDTFKNDKTMRQYAHKVVNQSLGGYF